MNFFSDSFQNDIWRIYNVLISILGAAGLRNMVSKKELAYLYAVLSAALFGGCAPVGKYMLGSIEPVILAGLFYLGSGFGLLIYILLQSHKKESRNKTEASLQKSDLPWLIGVVTFGGFLAPVILMYSLVITPAATASLLLNFEAVATSVIAFFIFREAVGRQIWTGLLLITISCIILTFDPSENSGFSPGAIGILVACLFWALDNNFSRNISGKDPVPIVCIKGIAAGLLSVIFGIITGQQLPALSVSLLAMLIGFLSYGGLTSVLFLLSLREIGTSRTGSLLAVSPFFGVVISFALFNNPPETVFYISFPLMAAGVILLIFEKHSHQHSHKRQTHEHRHSHDIHHNHSHDATSLPLSETCEHSHIHSHEELTHDHPHTPDIHHRHEH